MTYLDGEEKVTRTVREVQENMDTGWYAVTDEGLRYDDAIVVIGDVNLILCDHTNTFAANGVYITEGSTYRIPTTGIE